MLEIFEKAALAAGETIMMVYNAGCTVALKADRSPVTVADEKAEAIILAHLAAAFPEIPVIAEEAMAAGHKPKVKDAFFLVDPLDGTREFIEGRREFTVNIAYIEHGTPTAGIVYAPALGVAYVGDKSGAAKLDIDSNFKVRERLAITTRASPTEKIALASRCHDSPQTSDFLMREGITHCTNIGSSLKFCLLAEGKADIYPRFTRTMEWDTAAGDAVLRAAGGMTLTWEGLPLRYGKLGQHDGDFSNGGFVCSGRGN
ncbi:3'(2'),5'-bisphosphate nucleotidase CysQ [Oryzifoliimicrobium ureilyticus]|uniref:3'(2'),5'-bisphosphate nucleotidase CysQ n=1 Tax=Oryzifoliimicrobium ureilyticus TaxID=3113724 RepID=UPI003075FCA2